MDRPLMPPQPATVGIIANPVSARDVRRIITNASNLQVAERVNIVLRLLSTLGSLGVQRVLMMPDRAGIRAMLTRHLAREHKAHHIFPELVFLDMDVTSTVADTFEAARQMRQAGVKAIVVLGGDGTHRAAVRECGEVPIVGLSTGTNNAFPEMREPTVAALAVGLYATGRLSPEQALASNKCLDISINQGERHDIAIVDAVVSSDRYVGSRAVWQAEKLRAAYLTFADPQAIGLSAIGGLLMPVSRQDPRGLAVQLNPDLAKARMLLQAPIAPGLVCELGVDDWAPMTADQPCELQQPGGIVALDGERELPFEPGDRVQITLRRHAFLTLDVARCMHTAATFGLFHRFPNPA